MREERTMFAMDQTDVRTDLTGTVILCLIYSLGMLLSLFQLIPFRNGNRLLLWLSCWGILLSGWAFGRFAGRCRNWCFLFPVTGLFAGILYFGTARLLDGAQGFCNVLINGWNIRWEDGIPLLGNGQMTEASLAAFVFCLLMFLLTVFWSLARKRACIRVIILLVFCLLPEIVLRHSSSFGSMLLLTCAAGSWLLFYQSGSRIRRFKWLAGLGVVLTLVVFLSGRRQVPAVLKLQQEAVQAMNHIRYGEDLLPEGDLAKAWKMQNGDADTLLVSTEQVKPLYLLGFTGAEYENGVWRPLPKSAYGMERWGFLDWLKKNSFDVNAQYAAYESAGNETQNEQDPGYIPENHIEVNNKGANRKYIYTVYSGTPVSGSQIRSERDNGYRSAALFGNWVYQYSEKSADIPGELTQLAGWAYRPRTAAQERYLQGENVYRDFVYEHYLDIPEELKPEILQLFHDGDDSGSTREENQASEKGVYGITQDIRTVMEDRLYYRQVPEADESKDPLRSFLQGNSYGNSAYYASAGVLALRSFGIPARYAEGYYLSREKIEANGNGRVQLTERDSHAWTEAYMDGIGWIPVDFTPGFYYNTYALLRMAELPQNIRKTAALEDQGDEAENVTGNTPQNGQKEPDSLTENTRTDLIWGLVLVLLFGAEALLAALEISCWRYERRVHRPFGENLQQETAFLVHAVAQNLQAAGIEVRPGWKTAETEQQIRECFPDIPEGFYLRVNEILEKYIYGNIALKLHELRLLQRFLIALRSSRRNFALKQRIAFHYIGFRHGKPAPHYYDQA